MSLPRLAAQRPLLAVLCACALIAAALLLIRAAVLAGDGPSPSPHAAFAAEPTTGAAESGPADDGEDDDAVAHPPVPAHLRGTGTPIAPHAPRIAAAPIDPPQSPPPEA